MVIPPDQYFVMGDHRYNFERQPRLWTGGRELIYGKASFVYWPTEDMGIIQ